MTYRKVTKEMLADGWYEVRCKGSHHQFRKVGNPYVVTVPDKGSKDLAPGTLSDIRRKTGLPLRG